LPAYACLPGLRPCAFCRGGPVRSPPRPTLAPCSEQLEYLEDKLREYRFLEPADLENKVGAAALPAAARLPPPPPCASWRRLSRPAFLSACATVLLYSFHHFSCMACQLLAPV
jgi:hypothetical protein